MYIKIVKLKNIYVCIPFVSVRIKVFEKSVLTFTKAVFI